ncbi:MAG: hypothetical protein AAFQ62_15235 [Pseudomonadota bacterium]
MKKILMLGAGVVVLLAWLSLGVALTLNVSREILFVWVTAVALVTEAAIWLAAASLGVAVVQARQRIWQWFMRPFRDNVDV